MALHANTLWEIRTTGNSENGGGFHDRIPGTSVDYTAQNLPQLDLTDLACAAGSITITSVVGGFTQAMVGNVMQIHAGANFTVGFYEIVTWNSGNSVDVDRIPVTGVGANGHGKVGGGLTLMTQIQSVAVNGNVVYVKSGTYNYVANVTFSNGLLVASPIYVLGYDLARGTNPTGNNRPLIHMSTFAFTVPKFCHVHNLRIDGSNDTLVTGVAGAYCHFRNCYFENTAVAGASKYCLNPIQGVIQDCEFIGTAGATSTGINSGSAQVLNCYFHDLTNGTVAGVTTIVLYSIFNRVNYGVTYTAVTLGAGCIQNCTFCSIAIDAIRNTVATQIQTAIINNIFHNVVGNAINVNTKFIRNNLFFGCGLETVYNADYNENKVNADPLFTVPGTDFSLNRNSPAIDMAFSMRLGV